MGKHGGFHGHGGTPITGWFILYGETIYTVYTCIMNKGTPHDFGNPNVFSFLYTCFQIFVGFPSTCIVFYCMK